MRGIKLVRLVSIIKSCQILVTGLPKLNVPTYALFFFDLYHAHTKGPKFHCTLSFLLQKKNPVTSAQQLDNVKNKEDIFNNDYSFISTS